jgi:hypothetical protein
VCGRGGDVGDRGARPALVVGDRCGAGDLPDVEQVVRYAVPLVFAELCGADVHAAVELHRVGVDDLAVDGLRERDAESRLADSCWADNGDHGRVGRGRVGRGPVGHFRVQVATR